MFRILHSIYTVKDVARCLVYVVFKYQNETMDIKVYDDNKKYLYIIENQPCK